MLRKCLISLAVLALLSACVPTRDPQPGPDGGPPQRPNGNITNPERPDGIPSDFLFMSWHVIVLNEEEWEPVENVAVKVGINAASEVPGQNVHGMYPFEIYTYTPYTHTIWYAPGLSIVTDIHAVIQPPQKNFSVICLASSSNHVEEPFREIPPVHDHNYCAAQWAADIDAN